jgi:hypothetical protein
MSRKTRLAAPASFSRWMLIMAPKRWAKAGPKGMDPGAMWRRLGVRFSEPYVAWRLTHDAGCSRCSLGALRPPARL